MLTVDSNLITVDSTFITIDVTGNMANQFNILDYTSGPLLKTGQLLDQTPPGRTTKDDGGFQRGIAGSKADNQYNILTDSQYSGTTNITVNGFTDAHTNECVFDKVTSLMWNRETTSAIYGSGSEDLFWDDTAGSDEDVFKYCDQANLANLSGFNDWRVPNRNELTSLMIINAISTSTDKLPNTTAFPIWPNTGNIHTSTSRGDTVDYVFSINDGLTSNISKTLTRAKLILCRLGFE